MEGRATFLPQALRRLRTFVRRAAQVVVCVVTLVPFAALAHFERGAGQLEIRTLSNRADLISGGDALVEVVLPRRSDAARVRVKLNGRDVSSAFTTRDGRLIGLVTGLKVGKNSLTAQLKDQPVERLTITNHPAGGPIFSGPQLQPWICETESAGLAPATDSQCNAPTKVDYLYRSTDPAKTALLPYDRKNPPNDVASTTTDRGATVPFIVRREVGTLNRGIYTFVVLSDPAKAAPVSVPPPAWNRKLFYIFVGGAMPQHRQGPIPFPGGFFSPLSVTTTGEALRALSLGFATASSTLNIFAQGTNSVTSAETVMMVKERLIEQLGEVRHTISTGSSGGSMQQHLITNAYPGLLDGIQPGASFSDIWTVNTEVQDCSLLLRYFTATSPQLWSDITQQNAVMGNANLEPGTCRTWTGSVFALDAAWMNPTSTSCFAPGAVGAGIPQPWMYDPVTNPTGERCTMQDYQVALFGKRPDGFANRPFDNVGVQYGLRALRDGAISAEQFVDLNEKVGGRDIDWNPTAQRSRADPAAVRIAYRTGQVNLGRGMRSVPIIDVRDCSNEEVHSCYHTWVTRARLTKTNGHASNHVVFLNSPANRSFDVIDSWVSAIKADPSNASVREKIVRNKPAAAVDTCWINDQSVTDVARCAEANPYFSDARIVAGNSLDDDVLKCQLKPLQRHHYSVKFTDSQWARLKATFSSGVCDWSKPSVGFQPLETWLTFADGPGGRPLPPAPASSPHDDDDHHGRQNEPHRR